MVRVLAVICVLAVFTSAARAQSIVEITLGYVDEMIAAAAQQSEMPDRKIASSYKALLTEDARWLNPHNQRGLAYVLNHFALFGAEEFLLLTTYDARDAARVTITVFYDSHPGVEWPVVLDFIRQNDEWKITEIAQDWRHHLGRKASVERVLADYVAHLETAAVQHKATPTSLWLKDAIFIHWTIAGGGFWRLPFDCKTTDRDGCITALTGAATLWSALALDREKMVTIGPIERTGDHASSIVTVDIPRRTFTQTNQFELELSKDRRHGWQITQISRVAAAAPQQEKNVAPLFGDSEISLVNSLMETIAGPEALTQLELMQNIEVLEAYFEETPKGRQSMARLMGFGNFMQLYGIEPGGYVLEQSEKQIVASWPTARDTAPKLYFEMAERSDAPLVASVEAR